MLTCDACQAQMLESLYDLLEGDDREAFARHLGGCAACQAALLKARGQQQLLAAAARMEFPGVSFPPPETAPAVRPARPVPARSRSWVRLAAAAAVLLVLGGLGGTLGWLALD